MGPKIILLADDDRDDTEMFCEALSKIDKSLICYNTVNGSELLKKLNEIAVKPDLIFLDLNMPVMNGWQCMRKLKEDDHYKDIPVIMISTSSHQKEMDMAPEMGALCYFVKPNNFNELVQVLHIITENLGDHLKDTILNLQANKFGHIITCTDNNSKL